MAGNTLDTLIGLSREARDTAARLLADERRNEQALIEQLRLLESYRLEYAERLQAASDEGISLVALRDYQRFLASLDGAIASARAGMNNHQDRVKQCRQRWLHEQGRLHSFATLAERRDAGQQLLERRQDARNQDEAGANVFLRRRLEQARTD